ncbi:MAG: DEAD/DEAH box helicase [Limimaricola sp.]|uniref:DEAD/DEAH box helicase n=1 Tax=Limimaricola sp. TaxID=2211665 RepID=UPI001DCDDC37|nr:DEAD/DEAH box helicase [Limimaricola sp.]MBI1418477.1 DEAD/DEAH box helicase [Limimaricola sp.]
MTKFSDLNLDPKVLKAVADAGYETPTPIQAGAIPPALQGRDVLGIAQTGTGKTAGFVLPMVTLLGRGRARARMPRSLVLCPTRELAAQVAENFDTYAKYTKLTKALLIGGVSFKEQDAAIDRGVDVLIATPGRLLDHFERGKLLLTGVQIMVVDEADRMLDMGFIPDIERIFNLTPFTRQTLFFSATMAPEIERITNMFLSNPEKIEVARAATTGENISQGVVMFRGSRRENEGTEKRALLRALIDAEGDVCTNAIIFCNRKTDVDIVAKSLKKNGYNAEPIHGDLEQSQRMRTLDGFRDGTIKFLIASDVAARGLDIPAVSHVFNYDVPSHAEDYVHRIGRTGRAGRKGATVMICAPRDEKNLDAIERLVQNTIPRLSNPLGDRAAPANDAAETDAPAPAARSSRSRGGRGKTSRAPAPAAEAPAEVVAESAAPQTEAAPPKPRREPRRTERAPDAKPEPKAERKPERGRDRASRDGNVQGLGEDVPSFIAFSFDERRKG